jgi:hypothetical protein
LGLLRVYVFSIRLKFAQRKLSGTMKKQSRVFICSIRTVIRDYDLLAISLSISSHPSRIQSLHPSRPEWTVRSGQGKMGHSGIFTSGNKQSSWPHLVPFCPGKGYYDWTEIRQSVKFGGYCPSCTPCALGGRSQVPRNEFTSW